MKIRAYAKLNFYLEILNKRPDGFHNLRSIMQQIRLHDVLLFNHSSHDQLRVGSRLMRENNLVARALQLLREHVEVPPVKISLRKQIPIGAGLGGGSSDAAATLVGLNRFFDLGLEPMVLRNMASAIGSDVPFFIDTLAAMVEDTGTSITPMAPINVPHILLARPKGKISTVDVYKNLQPEDYSQSGGFELFAQLWDNGILGSCFNHLEAPAFRLDPRVLELKEEMLQTHPTDCLMTGSGNVVFAVYESKAELERARRDITALAQWTRATSTIKDNDE